MPEISNEKALNKMVWINSLVLVLKILLSCVLAFFYALSLFFVAVPTTSAKIFGFLGFKKAEEASYIRVYELSLDNADLYNVILFENKQDNTEKKLYYINLMLSSKDYDSFCIKYNQSSLASLVNSNNEINDKKRVPYICNINSYFLNQKVKCLNKLGAKSEIINNFVLNNLLGDDLFETSVATYVNIIYADNSLSSEAKIEKITDLLSVSNGEKSIDQLIDDRLISLDEVLSRENLPVVSKILANFAVMNLRLAEFRIAEVKGEGVTEAKTNYETAVSNYNNSIK